MDLELTDKVFLVTGGSRGLGRATVETLLAEGARVVVTGRSEQALKALAGPRVHTVVADNADPDAAPSTVATALSTFGRLDGALLSVGGPPAGTVMATTDEAWRSAFESVFLGAVRYARQVASAIEGPGSIALVLSTSVMKPLANLAVSNGFRPGLAMVAHTLANELGPRNIRVNGLLPGRVATDRMAELDSSTGDAEGARERSEAKIPLRRYGDPVEFAQVAAFLLSPRASYLSGVMLPVDGGATVAF